MKKIILFSFLLSSVALGGGADGVGNGGDGIRDLFNEARAIAIKNIERLDSCNLNKNNKPAIRAWLLEFKYKLVEDIKNSKHVWGEKNPEGTCAWTKRESHSDILFGWKDCKADIYNLGRASWLLIHESMHHFGIESEEFADDTASAVNYSTGLPNCRENPFSEQSCTSEKASVSLLANKTVEVELGKYELFSRTRSCKDEKGCGYWVYVDGSERVFYDESDRPVKVSVKGVAKLLLDSANNDTFLLTVGSRPCRVSYKGSFCDLSMGPNATDELYDKLGRVKQKLTFFTVFNGSCSRQYAKLSFRETGANEWLETEHVVFYTK